MQLNTCIKCKKELIEGVNWPPSYAKIKQYMCRDCKNTYSRKWREKNPGAYKEWKYGITQEEYDARLLAQGGKCAICRTTDPGGRGNNWNIDHCHETGEIRGLLCWSCNTGLGKFKDSKELLKNAYDYLRIRGV